MKTKKKNKKAIGIFVFQLQKKNIDKTGRENFFLCHFIKKKFLNNYKSPCSKNFFLYFDYNLNKLTKIFLVM